MQFTRMKKSAYQESLCIQVVSHDHTMQFIKCLIHTTIITDNINYI